ncbi:zinc finger, RING/FYVE/PHD-type containing protein [Tanacetum coccineum]
MDALFDDPTFMALSPIQMIEYLLRFNMSQPDPIPELTSVLSDFHRMYEDNVPTSIIELVMVSYHNYIQQVKEQVEKIEKHLQVSVREDKMDGQCSICMKEYGKNESIGTLDCRHEFHQVCVKNFLLRQSFFIFENFAFDIIYIDMFDETWTQEKLFMNARALIEGLGSMDAMNFTDTMYGNIRASKVVVVWKGTNHKKLKMWIHGSGLKLKNKKDDFQDLGEIKDEKLPSSHKSEMKASPTQC